MMIRRGPRALFPFLAAALLACGGSSSSAISGAQGVAVDVQPHDAEVAPGGTVAFLSAVSGSADTAVLWEVIESAGGTIDSTGVYTAPTTTGQYHVRAYSRANPSSAATSTVTVTAAPVISVAISPSTAAVVTGGTVTFRASVAGSTDSSVTWSVQEASGCGSVSSTGTYTAPAAAATCHVVATSHADPTKVATATVTVQPPSTGGTGTLRVSGRFLQDTCGNNLVIRGVEQPLGYGFETPAWDPVANPSGGSLENLVDEIAASGANGVRVLLDMADGQPSLARYDQLIGRAVGHGLIVYISNGSSAGAYDHLAFWGRADVKTLVAKYQKWIIIDALQEPGSLSRTAWRDQAIAAVASIRGQGYTVPLTVISNQDGRDLPAILQYGAEVVASDPLRKTIMGWQAYWGSSGWYQGDYGGQFGLSSPTSIANGITVAAQQSFPIQVGLDYRTDPGEVADYQAGMTAAAQNQIGWLWWAFWHPFEHRGAQNGLLDVQVDPARRRPGGVLDRLNEPYGALVVRSRDEGLASAVRACGR